MLSSELATLLTGRYIAINIHNLHRVISFLFNSVGSYVSPTNIAKELNKNSKKQISHNTIIKYLGFLTQSYILYLAPRYNIKGKELLTTNEKYYLVDLGLRNITATNKYDTDLGHKLENVVYFELFRRGGKVYVGKHNDKEIDFVVQKSNNEREYYQVAYTVNAEKTFQREISAFKLINDNYPKYLLTLDYDNANIDGIQKLNIIDWLLQPIAHSLTNYTVKLKKQQKYMNKSTNIKQFEKQVKNKFNVYNSLFLNLPFRKVSNIGMLIPLLHRVSKKGLAAGKDPQEIIELFFSKHTSRETEEQKIDFMMRVIQYVERQIVLFDSVEDAAFADIQRDGNRLSLQDFIYMVKGRKNEERIAQKLSDFSARIVFTAHPTQFYPPSVLDIISKLRVYINENDISNIDLALQQLGMTTFINSQKPTPLDEAKNIIYFLRNVYYDAVGNLYNYIKKSIGNSEFNNTDIIKLGFWPGGDRDGNPFVTADITMAVADELRMSLMKCYYYDIKDLGQKMTFRGVEGILASLREEIYPTLFDSTKIVDYKHILHQLELIKEKLTSKYNSLYLEDLNNFIDKVTIFRNHFAVLDIRQDHSVHKKTIEAILKKEQLISNSMDELNEEELISILLNKKIVLDESQFDEEIIKDSIKTITQLKIIQKRNGEEGSNRYIISNSEDIYSVLFVYALFHWCGWERNELTFDIIPLFESMAGMRNSGDIMKRLFDIPEYRAHVNKRQNKQTMMLGFSDGTKDGGYLRANWSIFETKETLSAVCAQYDVKALFFDGRGGPPARGGGKSHQFYASQSQEIANHEIQLTIQGQTITSKYGTKEQFVYNFEQLLTAGLSTSIFKEENSISEESRKIIEDLANISFEKYDALKKHEKFIPYLENKSTLKYYGQANIGSRPAKRGTSKKLELKDLRAISFVGSWSQLSQNVPGYFGIGTAIKTLVDQGKLNDLQNLFKKVPFFKTLILNSMMSLSKSNFALTAYIAKDEEYKEFWNILNEEYKLSKEMVLLISGYEVLMEEEPVTRSSIEIRERIVLPLQVIQQYALQKIEQNSKHKTTYEKIVRRSLYGNINASRNSA